MGDQVWTVAEAKAKFSEVIERAMSEGRQTITRKGRTAAVVVGAEEWQRKTNRAMNQLERLQRLRQGDRVPAPVNIQLSGDTSTISDEQHIDQ